MRPQSAQGGAQPPPHQSGKLRTGGVEAPLDVRFATNHQLLIAVSSEQVLENGGVNGVDRSIWHATTQLRRNPRPHPTAEDTHRGSHAQSPARRSLPPDGLAARVTRICFQGPRCWPVRAGSSGVQRPECYSFRSQQIRGTRWKKRGVGGSNCLKNVVAEVERLASEALCLAAMQGPCNRCIF